ncbi:MAG: hypothetical protein CTY35_10800 [Methylotenera sp.]|nr:MAG: hypothetical protein CTY35_10800 [Methylotenera sp.]
MVDLTLIIKMNNRIVMAFLVLFTMLLYLGWYLVCGKGGNQDLPEQELRVGNMNGVELTIPGTYYSAFMEYANESAWRPEEDTPIRTYSSKIDSFELSAKWPNFEHRYQNNNLISYKSRDDINGSREWIDISVQSLFENQSPELQLEIIEDTKNHGLYFYPLFLALTNGVTAKLDKYQEGHDEALRLMYIKPTGDNANETYGGNNIYYWDGVIDIGTSRNNRDETYGSIINDGKLNTVIQCPGGVYKKNIFPKCKQYFLLPEMSAKVTIYYYRELLPHWKDIQNKSVVLILSLRDKNTLLKGSK